MSDLDPTRTCETCGKVSARSDKPLLSRRTFMALRYCSHQCYFVARRSDPVGKYWAKVERGPGCWLWRGPTSHGYGRVRFQGNFRFAHRVAFELATGIDPHGSVVMHSCDNPLCVNPDHLTLGTQTQNIADMDAKGRRRAAKGERNGSARLTEDQVRAIRSDGRSADVIAEGYPVTVSGIHAIRNGRTWKHLA